MLRTQDKKDKRPLFQIREHYDIEVELAKRLRNSSRDRRSSLYNEVYNELFQRVPNHPTISKKVSNEDTLRAIEVQMKLLRGYLTPATVFLEVGPGSCGLAFQVAQHVKQVYGVDVSSVAAERSDVPSNFSLVLSDGRSVPVPENSCDVAYSNQLMEHLHPEDALEQLTNIHKSIKPGGWYICQTPHRVGGPWDISKYFDKEARGFHLKEYTMSELISLFRDAGFDQFRAYLGGGGHFLKTSPMPVLIFERLAEYLPYPLRWRMGAKMPFRVLLSIRLAARKPT